MPAVFPIADIFLSLPKLLCRLTLAHRRRGIARVSPFKAGSDCNNDLQSAGFNRKQTNIVVLTATTAVEQGLAEPIQKVLQAIERMETNLKSEIKQVENEVKLVASSLKSEVKQLDTRLSGEIFKQYLLLSIFAILVVYGAAKEDVDLKSVLRSMSQTIIKLVK